MDRDGLGGPTLMENHGDDTLARTQGVSILSVIGVGWRPRQERDAWYKLRMVDRVVDLGMEQG